MAKLPTVFSLRHLLVLSLALNVSLILRILVYEVEQGHDRSCSNTEGRNTHKTRMVISSSTSPLANSTCTDHIGGRNRVINLDQ